MCLMEDAIIIAPHVQMVPVIEFKVGKHFKKRALLVPHHTLVPYEDFLVEK